MLFFWCVFPCSFAIITTTVIVSRVGDPRFVRWRVQEAVWTVGLWSRTVRQQHTPNKLNISPNVICETFCFICPFDVFMFLSYLVQAAFPLYWFSLLFFFFWYRLSLASVGAVANRSSSPPKAPPLLLLKHASSNC